MNITHYYLEQEHCTQQKNNLHKEAKAYLDSISKKMILAQDLEELEKIIHDKINELNQKHSRCKSISLSIFRSILSKNYRVSGIEGVNFYIKPAELSHLTSFIK